jgi:hypothetical protein
MRQALDADVITVVLTSCGRWDLLTQSIDTFLAHHRPDRFLLIEDSANEDFARLIRERYPAIEVVLNNPRLGQHAAIDKAYGMVTTPMILHLEDDWLFTGPMDVNDALAVLAGDERIVSVCFSVFARSKFRHRIFGKRFKHGDRSYARMEHAHRDWYGYSFYPTLLRRKTWEDHGPFARFANERAISRYMKDRGLGLVYQLPGVGLHVGSGRSVFDPARAGERRRVTGAFWRRLRGRDAFAPGGNETPPQRSGSEPG